MALIGNRSSLLKSPGRFLAGGPVCVMRSAFNTHAMQRGAYPSYSAKSATPDGHLSPSAWVLPTTAGGISSRNVTVLEVSTVGFAVGGITADGESSITFTIADAQAFPLDDTSPLRTGTASLSLNFADAAGQLISSGEGSATLSISAADALLIASLGGAGTAEFSITVTPALLGAIAEGTGSAGFAIVVGNAQAYPLNDASPLREGTAGFTISGSLVPYARGSMVGSTTDSGSGVVLTADAIATAVLAAAANSPISANIKRINSSSVQGTGVSGDEWGPAP